MVCILLLSYCFSHWHISWACIFTTRRSFGLPAPYVWSRLCSQYGRLFGNEILAHPPLFWGTCTCECYGTVEVGNPIQRVCTVIYWGREKGNQVRNEIYCWLVFTLTISMLACHSTHPSHAPVLLLLSALPFVTCLAALDATLLLPLAITTAVSMVCLFSLGVMTCRWTCSRHWCQPC